MIFLSAIVIALIAGAAGAFATGFVAALAVDWYRIPSREGNSGYFVLFLGIGGLIAGAVVGFLCAFVMWADSFSAFLAALGVSLLIVLVGNGVGALISRLMADIPPKLDGHKLLLEVELRLPAECQESPSAETGEAYVQLHSLPRFKHRMRKSETGPMWVDEATKVDGRWIVRAAAFIFTRRGKRVLSVTFGKSDSFGFDVPLPANPGRKYLQWSGWLPRSPFGTPIAMPMSYRFRIHKTNEPMKTETVGEFEIDTITRWYQTEYANEKTRVVSSDVFQVRHGGKRVNMPGDQVVAQPDDEDRWLPDMAITFDGQPSAVIVRAANGQQGQSFYLLRDVGDQLQVTEISMGYTVSPLTEPPADWPVPIPTRPIAPMRKHLPAGLYKVGFSGVIETRRLVVCNYKLPDRMQENEDALSLGVSPDGRSFVRKLMRYDESMQNSQTGLGVTDIVTGDTTFVEIDRRRMHLTRSEQLTRGWVEHHFAWTPDEKGVYRLTERPDFTPVPYRGQLTTDSMGGSDYRIDTVDEDMRTAIEAFLVERFGATRHRDEYESDYEHPFMIDGVKVSVSHSADSAYVLIDFHRGFDAAKAQQIAEAFDAELATGKHDDLFGRGAAYL